MDFANLSRRNFIKKTTVLSVGTASLGLFAGLVNAEDEGPYCKVKRKASELEIPNGPVIAIWECWTDDVPCNRKIECGRVYQFDANGEPIVDENGKIIWHQIKVDCVQNRATSPTACFDEFIV